MITFRAQPCVSCFQCCGAAGGAAGDAVNFATIVKK